MKSSYLLVNDLRVHYLHLNLEGEGRPIVLLHSLASNARSWELVAPHLAQNGLLPLAPDQRGHGLTDKPDGDYSFNTFTQDLMAFIDASNLERPVLAGYGWGANLALTYAARLSFGPRAAAGLILIDGGMTQLDDAPGATWDQVREKMAPPYLAGTPLSDYLKTLNDGQSSWTPDDQIIPILLSNFEISEDETIEPRLTYDRHLQILRSLWEFKTYDLYPRIRCPVFMIPNEPPPPYSAADREALDSKEKGLRIAAERITKLRVHWMREAIRDMPLQRPDEMAALITDFNQSIPA